MEYVDNVDKVVDRIKKTQKTFNFLIYGKKWKRKISTVILM